LDKWKRIAKSIGMHGLVQIYKYNFITVVSNIKSKLIAMKTTI